MEIFCFGAGNSNTENNSIGRLSGKLHLVMQLESHGPFSQTVFQYRSGSI